MITFYDELIDFLCPNTRETLRPLTLPASAKIPSGRTWKDIYEDLEAFESSLLPKCIQHYGRGECKSSYPHYKATYHVKLNPEFFKPKQISQMKQPKFNKADMISVITPRGTTVAVLAEDFTYEKPCMVAVKTMLTHDGILTISDSVGQGQLYIHQDCIEVRLANEQEGLLLFSAIKASGADKPKGNEKKEEREFEPKDGDFCLSSADCFCIYKEGKKQPFVYVGWNFECLTFNTTSFTSHVKRLLTEKEIARFLDALSADGKTWNATEKRVEKVLWRASKGENYWMSNCDPSFGDAKLRPELQTEHNTMFDDAQYEIGDYHKTEAECQVLCDAINGAYSASKESRIKLN